VSIIVLAKRFPPGNIRQEALYITKSDQGDSSWHLRTVEFEGLFAEPIPDAIAKRGSTLVMAGTIPTLLHGLVDRMADWGASDDEIIPLADFIPRLEDRLAEIAQALVELVQDREVI
jgi:hypothetical protein